MTRLLVSALPFDMPVTEEGYVEILRYLADEMQSKHGECEATP